ncbi:hypothetical protein MFM001_24480 [Mycobacterium sp. MFM001]|nr:hypothetical protein MFM001_24480 [Mycobacterium sp. MFM001]
MSAHGISDQKGPQALIQMGHEICGLLGDGYSVNGLAQHLALSEQNGMTDDDTKYLVQTSAAAYCPQYLS